MELTGAKILTQKETGRMLLAHNFNLIGNSFPALDRTEFCHVFVEGLKKYQNINCRLVDNPHWQVEILYSIAEFSASEVGQLCAQALRQKRLDRSKDNQVSLPEIILLGGIKTTPATSTSPDSLQPGEWGVDVIETAVAEEFLTSLGWEAAIASKPNDSVFKIVLGAESL